MADGENFCVHHIGSLPGEAAGGVRASFIMKVVRLGCRLIDEGNIYKPMASATAFAGGDAIYGHAAGVTGAAFQITGRGAGGGGAAENPIIQC